MITDIHAIWEFQLWHKLMSNDKQLRIFLLYINAANELYFEVSVYFLYLFVINIINISIPLPGFI